MDFLSVSDGGVVLQARTLVSLCELVSDTGDCHYFQVVGAARVGYHKWLAARS